MDIAGGVLWALATTNGTLSVVSVLGGTFPAVTVALSVLLLRDWLEAGHAVGVLLALVGCAVAAS